MDYLHSIAIQKNNGQNQNSPRRYLLGKDAFENIPEVTWGIKDQQARTEEAKEAGSEDVEKGKD